MLVWVHLIVESRNKLRRFSSDRHHMLNLYHCLPYQLFIQYLRYQGVACGLKFLAKSYDF